VAPGDGGRAALALRQSEDHGVAVDADKLSKQSVDAVGELVRRIDAAP
jgi:hypothetical protein